MKKIFTLLAAIIITSNIFAQAPQKMSYQAVIRKGTSNLVTNTPVSMRISILQGDANGTAVYSELHNPTTNDNGLVSVEIGVGTSPTGTFSAINWENGPYYLKTETDPNNGTNYTITGTSQLLSVPYALQSNKADSSKYADNAKNGFTHYIGEQYGGGVIFHLWKDAQGVEHGLIVALTDQSVGTVWSNVSITSIGTSAQSSWNGLTNSNAIVAQAGHTSSAAKLCLDLVSGGQTDWYLPSIQELSMLWNNYYTVARSLSQITGATQITPAIHWSSTEFNNGFAWFLGFLDGTIANNNKSAPYDVRAVRAF
jgi:hypothetical protein